MILVRTKCDLDTDDSINADNKATPNSIYQDSPSKRYEDSPIVPWEEANALAKRLGFTAHLKCSAFTSDGVAVRYIVPIPPIGSIFIGVFPVSLFRMYSKLLSERGCCSPKNTPKDLLLSSLTLPLHLKTLKTTQIPLGQVQVGKRKSAAVFCAEPSALGRSKLGLALKIWGWAISLPR
jgi:hypothetical protein